jgi:hypothetical protein
MATRQLKTQTKGLWHKVRPVMQTSSLTRFWSVYGAGICLQWLNVGSTLATTN